MSAFSTFRLTDAGLLLAAKGQTGAQIEYTRVVVGDGLLPEGQSVRSLTNVIHAVMDLSITGFDLFEDDPPNFTAVIKSAFNNFQLQNGFYYRELALFATDPDAGEVLYCYANAGELAEWIPSMGSPALIEKDISIAIVVGASPNITAIIPDDLFAKQKDLDELRETVAVIRVDVDRLILDVEDLKRLVALKADKTEVDKKADKTEVAKKANKSTIVTAVLRASGWVGGAAPYNQTINIQGVTATSANELLPGLSITADQLEKLQAANLQDGGQAVNSITVKAFGEKPDVDLPLRVIVRGDL